MGKHLLNLKSTTKGNLADGKRIIGDRGQLAESKIKQLQKCYRHAVPKNIVKKTQTKQKERLNWQFMQ